MITVFHALREVDGSLVDFGYGEMGWAAASVGFFCFSFAIIAFCIRGMETEEGRKREKEPRPRACINFLGIRILRLGLQELGAWFCSSPSLGSVAGIMLGF